LETITISTRGNSISQYALTETGKNTGIFTGYIILTGDPRVLGDHGVDGHGKQPTGAGPSGVGPTDGLLPSEDRDGISITFVTPNYTVTKSALIHWNNGLVSWLQTSGPSSIPRILQIVDHDMNLNPNTPDTLSAYVFSNSDLAGINLNLTETGLNTGIFHGIVRFTNDTTVGKKLHISGGDNTITGYYTDRTLPAPYTSADQTVINATTIILNGNTSTSGQPLISLDKSNYTWTDQVNITITSPTLNLNPSKIETIGNNALGKITISTNGHSISHYKLVETGPNTGIFKGYVILTGDPNIATHGGVDGNGLEPTGAGPSGIGPTGGMIPAQNIDGISVSFQNQQTTVATAPIRWNIGTATNWLQSSYPHDGSGICQIVDPDMNLNPLAIDKLSANIWSDTDSGGIRIVMTETGKSTGVFQGTVHFTNSTSSGNNLHVSQGDTVTCAYKDRTLPLPYSPSDQLRTLTTTLISP
jgi:hypothetical protein